MKVTSSRQDDNSKIYSVHIYSAKDGKTKIELTQEELDQLVPQFEELSKHVL